MSTSENISNGGNQPKLIRLLSHFSSEEMDSFHKFVKSEYFNTDERLVVLTQFLKDKFFDGKERQFDETTKRKVYDLMFSEKKVKEKLSPKENLTLNNKLSKLVKLGVKFLQVEYLKKDSPELMNLYYKQLTERKLSKIFKKQQKDDRTLIDEQTEKDINYYLKKYYIENSELDYMSKHDIDALVKNSNFPAVVNALDVYYLIRRFKLQIFGFSLMGRTKKEYSFESIKHILELSKLPQYDCPLLNAYRTAYELEWHKRHSKNDAEEYAVQLQGLLNKHDEELPHDLKVDFYTVLSNFYIRQVKTKDLTYSRKVFKLFKDLHDKGLLLSDNKIRIGKLNATITASCHAEEFEWAKDILEKYREHIQEEDDNVYKFNLGQIAFYQKQYDQADNLFLEVEQSTKHQSYSNNCRILRLKCLYELENNLNYLESTCKSAVGFMSKHKLLSDVDRKAQINFINILSKLYRIKKGDKDIEQLENINAKIKGFDYISDVRWLKEKIAELQQKKS